MKLAHVLSRSEKADIDLDRYGLSPQILNLLRYAPGVFKIYVDNYDVGPLLGERKHDGLADTSGSTGYQSNFTLKFHVG